MLLWFCNSNRFTATLVQIVVGPLYCGQKWFHHGPKMAKTFRLIFKSYTTCMPTQFITEFLCHAADVESLHMKWMGNTTSPLSSLAAMAGTHNVLCY